MPRQRRPGALIPVRAVNFKTLMHLEPLLPDASDDVLAVAGALTFEAGYTAARSGETGTAWEQAHAMADRLQDDYQYPVTAFSRAIMGAHAVTVTVEPHQGGAPYRRNARPGGTGPRGDRQAQGRTKTPVPGAGSPRDGRSHGRRVRPSRDPNPEQTLVSPRRAEAPPSREP